jgi:hypothetical protein
MKNLILPVEIIFYVPISGTQGLFFTLYPLPFTLLNIDPGSAAGMTFLGLMFLGKV